MTRADRSAPTVRRTAAGAGRARDSAGAPAGTRALAMYRATRRRRRRRAATAVGLVALAALSAIRGWPTPAPLALAALGLVTLVSASVGGLRDADRWRRGAEGERRTAALLDGLASRRWAVWHDLQVPGSRANIDHLVVGRTGVWVVDTKTPRGQVKSGWRSVRMGDRRLDTGPVTWEAEMVAERLDELVGARLRRPLVVRPVVAVHGAELRPRGVRVQGVRVVGADRLVARIRRGRTRLPRTDRHLIGRAVDEGLA